MHFRTSPVRFAGFAAVIAATVALLGPDRLAHADVVAAYLEGYGGLSSPQSVQTDGNSGTAASSSGALGVQAGLRFLIFEGYGDHTSFGSGSSVERGIVGLRGAFGIGGMRLVLRGGGGVISEHGGALTGHLTGVSDRSGAVARAGVALEKKLAPTLLAGFGLEGEAFSVMAGGVPTQTGGIITGTDVLASFHLKFEIGI